MLVAPGSLWWRHNDHDSVSNQKPHECLFNRLLRRRSKKTSKLHVTGLCVGNSPGPVNSPHKGPVTRKMFPFDDVIMIHSPLACLHDDGEMVRAIIRVYILEENLWIVESFSMNVYMFILIKNQHQLKWQLGIGWSLIIIFTNDCWYTYILCQWELRSSCCIV